MIKYQHKNFGKKLRIRAGWVDSNRQSMKMKFKMVENWVSGLFYAPYVPLYRTVCITPKRAIEYIVLNVIITPKGSQVTELPVGEMFEGTG